MNCCAKFSFQGYSVFQECRFICLIVRGRTEFEVFGPARFNLFPRAVLLVSFRKLFFFFSSQKRAFILKFVTPSATELSVGRDMNSVIGVSDGVVYSKLAKN